jgi:hypothetical protein
MTLLTKSIDHYVDELLGGDDDIVHVEAVAAFIAKNEEIIALHVGEIVRRAIGQSIKRRSTVPPPPRADQGVLFPGFPAALTVSAGVTRPIGHCTRADLQAARNVKVDGIAAAEGWVASGKARLEAYDADVRRLAPFMPDDTTTVDEAARLLERQRTDLRLVPRTGRPERRIQPRDETELDRVGAP